MYPYIQVIEQGNYQGGPGLPDQRRNPQDKETKNIHAVGGIFEYPLADKWFIPENIGLEVIQAESSVHPKICFYGIKKIDRRYSKESG